MNTINPIPATGRNVVRSKVVFVSMWSMPCSFCSDGSLMKYKAGMVNNNPNVYNPKGYRQDRIVSAPARTMYATPPSETHAPCRATILFRSSPI